MQYLQRNNYSNNKVWNNLNKAHTRAHTYKLKLTTNLSNHKNILDPFIVNNKTTPTLNNPSQLQPTKFGKKKKKTISHIFFSWETKKRKVVNSLHNLLSDLLYQWHIFKQRQCLEGPNKICDTKWVEIVYDIIIYKHSFETWIVQRIVKGRGSKFLKSDWS